MQIPTLTTRFNEKTWQENSAYREKNKINGCIYGSATKMKFTIPLNEVVFIIEMNNSTNNIEGISLVRNVLHFDKYYKIYDAGTYNRYVYKSEYRIDRLLLDPYLVEILDNICFKGKTHLKRGIGFTSIPEKLKRNVESDVFNIEKCIRKEFKEKFVDSEMIIERIYAKEENQENLENLGKRKKEKRKKVKLIIVD